MNTRNRQGLQTPVIRQEEIDSGLRHIRSI